MPQHKCKDCKWWEFVRQLGCSSELSSKEYNKDVGYCHRNPPVLVGGIKKWPEMVEDDWCGEFEAKVCKRENPHLSKEYIESMRKGNIYSVNPYGQNNTS